MVRKNTDITSHIDKLIEDERSPPDKQRKKKLTVMIDPELWERSRAMLEGKYSALMEAAIKEYMEKVEKKP